MSTLAAVSPVSSTLAMNPHGAAAGSSSPAPPAAHAPETVSPTVPVQGTAPTDSVSISNTVLVHGHSVSAVVTYSFGDYVASEPGPPEVSARGSSPAAAADRLENAANLFA